MSKIDSDPRCVLTMPLETEPWQEAILEKRFRIMEDLKNSLIRFEKKKLNRLVRSRSYVDLIKAIRNAPPKERGALHKQRDKMLKDAGFDEFTFKDDMTLAQKHFACHITAQVSRMAAKDVWQAFKKNLFGDGNYIHFQKRGTLDSIACEKIGNSMHYKDGQFLWPGGRAKDSILLSIPVAAPRTEYEQAMLRNEIKYLRVVRRWSKRRFKYYLQFMLVGVPFSKHRYPAEGRVGIDIGPQTAAIVSPHGVLLTELADRVQKKHERKIALQRKMDASRRACNPDNYNPDGTIRRRKPGEKRIWIQSGHYRRLAAKVRELERKNADIRRYQHNCLANAVLTLGDEVYVELMNFKGQQRRAKETKTDERGRPKKKKRFGRSIANKAPAAFLMILKNKLRYAGSELHEVDTYRFRASQYDHISQTYKKKLLSQRYARLANGDVLQRDLYSAFLLMNAETGLEKANQQLCEDSYPHFKALHDREIERIRHSVFVHPSSFGIAPREP